MSSPLLKKVLHKKKRRSRMVKFIDDPGKLYQLDTLLGEGAYGKVYLGLSLQDGKEYAIKIVHVTDDIVEVQKEIHILRKCDNEYVVRYHDSFIHRKLSDIWIILEYCHGGSVEDVIKIINRPLSEAEIRYILKDVLAGLQYLHERKRIHRDIKSGNILISQKGVSKLTDFGVSIELTNSMSKRNSLIGTPYWMAPEVIREVRYDEKADIWSIGITVIEMAEKEPPLFRFQPMRALFIIPNRRPPTLQRPSDFSRDLQDFLSQCLKKDPEKRSSSKELLRHPFLIDTGPKRVLPKGQGHPMILSLIAEVDKKLEAYGGDKQKYFQKMMKDSKTGGRRRGISSSLSNYSSSSSYTEEEEEEEEEESGTRKLKKKKDDSLTRPTDSSDDEYSDYEDSYSDDDSEGNSLRKKKKGKKKKNAIPNSLDRKLEMFQSNSDSDSERRIKQKQNFDYDSEDSPITPMTPLGKSFMGGGDDDDSEETSEYKSSEDEVDSNASLIRKKRKKVVTQDNEEEDVVMSGNEENDISDLKLKVMEMEEEMEDLKQEISNKNRKITELEKKVSRLKKNSNSNSNNNKNNNINSSRKRIDQISKLKKNQVLVKKFLQIQIELLKNKK